MLRDIKNFLRLYRQASLYEVSTHFDVQPQATRAMLDHWIRKGYVCLAERSANCGSTCGQCHPLTTEIYCWAGEG